MTLRVLIIGANGFIGSHLVDTILQEKDWHVVGFDINDHHIKPFQTQSRFEFTKGDMLTSYDWIEGEVAKADVVLPLAAIATPSTYVKDPLKVFELDFEANLPIVRMCVKHKKRLIFPSTSEVYGMCADEAFDEETSSLVMGPVTKPRWIYACSKQLMDRIIIAYGDKEGLNYTLFRPFNWIGPRQDDINNTSPGGSRVLTQFIANLMQGNPIHLINGGEQKRCFTYIQDGVDALVSIIEQHDAAKHRIFNIGNPALNHSIKTLAETVLATMQSYPRFASLSNSDIIVEKADDYYGKGYQDVQHRVPSIERAKRYLGWEPKIGFDDCIRKTVSYYLD